jgi:hypothetical protein
MLSWTKRIGWAAAALLAILISWPFLLAVVLIGAGLYIGRKWRQWYAVKRFRAVWHPQGKDLLLVYSNSPNWQRHVEEQWLPKWRQRAVVLNWSERKAWRASSQPEASLFRAFAGDREFNPLVIFIPKQGDVRLFRFWRAFRDYKHGKDRLLRLVESELESTVDHSTLSA